MEAHGPVGREAGKDEPPTHGPVRGFEGPWPGREAHGLARREGGRPMAWKRGREEGREAGMVLFAETEIQLISTRSG